MADLHFLTTVFDVLSKAPKKYPLTTERITDFTPIFPENQTKDNVDQTIAFINVFTGEKLKQQIPNDMNKSLKDSFGLKNIEFVVNGVVVNTWNEASYNLKIRNSDKVSIIPMSNFWGSMQGKHHGTNTDSNSPSTSATSDQVQSIMRNVESEFRSMSKN
ncbi:hypothetical protein O9G_005644 [Rozella allomycis CSF55]|uniref:Uncharacterized protein n=1 Tax=Rozella allomycis (strain CSF55) TaxID=988480 RepID=A0A075AQV0_ROZAC|nr:hypothetical protein O9G_005644 [Rozella allomycis CSF55]|eukprot:EPZ32578.1 hypothetical protein O9G_005644 [Rozella allomycis CSF55]